MSPPSSHKGPLLQDRTKESSYQQGRGPATGSQGGGGGDSCGKTVKCKNASVYWFSLLNKASSRPKLALIPFCDPWVHQGLAYRRCVLLDSLLK